MLVAGEKEAETERIAVRFRDGRPQELMKIEEFIGYVKEKVESRFAGI